MHYLLRKAFESRAGARGIFRLGLPLALLTLPACAPTGQYVWFKDLPAAERTEAAGDYVIGVGDQINIRVYEQEPLSGDAKIRTDGKIALPLLGELMVAGRHPIEVSKDIEKRLKEFIVSPRVTVNVTVSQPITVTVLGEVRGIGSVTLDPPGRLVEALAKAGGLGEYADESKIFVLRQFPTYQRIRFKWESVLHNEGGAATFPLRTGDVIVVE